MDPEFDAPLTALDRFDLAFLDFITKGPGLVLIIGLLVDAAILTAWQQFLLVVTK